MHIPELLRDSWWEWKRKLLKFTRIISKINQNGKIVSFISYENDDATLNITQTVNCEQDNEQKRLDHLCDMCMTLEICLLCDLWLCFEFGRE